MNNVFLRNIIRFVVLILVQVFILNNIRLGGYINPYLYVYFILLLPFETPKWLLLISAFFLGLSVDYFSDTMGMHAAASVLMAFSRPLVLSLISSRREYEQGIKPSILDLGFRWFFTYSLILVAIHHLLYFYLEVFRTTEFFITLYRAFISIVFTILLIILTQVLFHKKG
ncbi:MAG: hypothetical protein K9J13_15440 [Saprospiraceae bacterium]|nr:hypothetical protein [Saprospiraceae bacterium]